MKKREMTKYQTVRPGDGVACIARLYWRTTSGATAPAAPQRNRYQDQSTSGERLQVLQDLVQSRAFSRLAASDVHDCRLWWRVLGNLGPARSIGEVNTWASAERDARSLGSFAVSHLASPLLRRVGGACTSPTRAGPAATAAAAIIRRAAAWRLAARGWRRRSSANCCGC